MSEIIAKRVLKKELTEEQKAERSASYIFFYPEHKTGMEAVKDKFGETDRDEIMKLIPEIAEYAQLSGPTKFKDMENPAGVPIIFMANTFFVGTDSEDNIPYDLCIETGKPRSRRIASETEKAPDAEDRKILAMAKRVPLFKTAKRRKAA